VRHFRSAERCAPCLELSPRRRQALLEVLYSSLDKAETRLRDGPEEALSSTERIFKTLYMPDETRGGGPSGWLVGPVGERPVLVCLLHSAQSKYFDSKARKGALDAVRCSRPRDARSVLARSAACMRAPASPRRHQELQPLRRLTRACRAGSIAILSFCPRITCFCIGHHMCRRRTVLPPSSAERQPQRCNFTCSKRATRSTYTCCT
jgi:hypothetical protein